ncbi:MAG: hypothetical protein OEZ36_12255, partial [Spirochaetota bacterium]|nr:hypothetical protein [Spirochaetota bacterium]
MKDREKGKMRNMTGNKLRILVATRFFIVAIIVLIFDRIVFSHFAYLVYDKLSLWEIIKNNLQFYSINVIPNAAFWCFIIAVMLKPLQEAVNVISRGERPSEELYHKSRKVLSRLPKLVLLINLVAYVLGTVYYQYTHKA